MIVITGATGKVGSKTTEILLAQGHKLRLVARKTENLKPFEAKGAEVWAGNLNDADFLTRAFNGADVVLTMMPADMNTNDIYSFQDAMGEAIIAAIKASGVKKVVNLSSLGGHTTHKTGIVKGLAKQEVRLNALPDDIAILHLRPGYFMENLFGNIGIIKNFGVNGSSMNGNAPIRMIATKDIAVVAAEKLANPNFAGKSVLPLMGPRDYTMSEVTSVLGKAIGKDDLQYVIFPEDQAKAGMLQWGISESVADSYIELNQGMNEGAFIHETRTAETTTPTEIGEFAQTFAYVYSQN